MVRLLPATESCDSIIKEPVVELKVIPLSIWRAKWLGALTNLYMTKSPAPAAKLIDPKVNLAASMFKEPALKVIPEVVRVPVPPLPLFNCIRPVLLLVRVPSVMLTGAIKIIDPEALLLRMAAPPEMDAALLM